MDPSRAGYVDLRGVANATRGDVVANAKERYEAIRKLIDSAGSRTLDLMLSILRHRVEGGASICQRDEELNMHSRPGYVAMPAERAVLLTDDYPDKSEYGEYAL
jgi:gamma-glutamylcysteine synthetase